MAYDGLVMRGVAQELNQLLAGGRLDKIAQPNKHEIILHIRSQGGNHKLLLSALAQEARVHVAAAAPPNPERPPVFCMVLRKHLEGGRILSFEQAGLDRILAINVQALDEFGDLREKRLIAEIMGKHSNLILTDPSDGRIIDSLRRVTEAISRYRQILPGITYAAPPAREKLPLWLEREDTLAPRLMALGLSKSLDQVILSAYDGLGPLSVQELIHRAGFSPVDTLEYFGQADYLRLYRVIAAVGQDLLRHQYQPEILIQDGRPKDFAAIALSLYPPERRQPFPRLNTMLDAYFKDRGVANLFRQKQADLEQIIRREQERCRKKAGLQAAAVLEGQEAEQWRIYGQLLTAAHYHLAQGATATVENFYEAGSPPISIPLDPLLTPLANAQAYFRRYQKARQTAVKAQTHYEETLTELSYLDSVAHSLTTVTTLPELADIREEIQAAGYLKAAGRDSGAGGFGPGRSRPGAGNGSGAGTAGAGKKGGRGARGGPANQKGRAGGGPKDDKAGDGPGLSFGRATREGFDILYGKNNKQNDYLTTKLSKSGDLWLHAQKLPSAHVVVRNPAKREIPPGVIETAAKICLWHSRAKAAGRAAVDYTKRQNVWKPKGAKPGLALYENYQTLYVTVTEDEIEGLGLL